MRRDFRLGSILGIEVRVHFSWFIVFLLILWALSASLFPAFFPELPGHVHMAMGVSATLLFFASLLGHELAHSIVARSKGIRVEGITLFVFGGVARTAREAQKPADEFLIAIVGPLASVLIGCVFALLWLAGTRLGWSSASTGVAGYLALLNLLLAVFNMLPGFPMDGGRVLRAALWRLTGDLKRATRISATGGVIVGFALIALGIWRLFDRELLGGTWLVFIGLFLRQTASNSYRQHVVRSVLDTTSAREVMTPHPASVTPSLGLQALADDWLIRRLGTIPVAEAGQLLGRVDLHDVDAIPRELWPQLDARAVMVPLNSHDIVGPRDTMSQVLDAMRDSSTGRLFVTQDGNLVGVITATAVTNWLERARSRNY